MAAAAVMTMDDDRNGDDVTITTSGYETFQVTVTVTVLPRSVRAKGANKGN
jgi:hypothetical protein